MQFWPPDDEHMGSKHVEAWNKLIVKQKFCASSWLITEIKKLRVKVYIGVLTTPVMTIRSFRTLLKKEADILSEA